MIGYVVVTVYRNRLIVFILYHILKLNLTFAQKTACVIVNRSNYRTNTTELVHMQKAPRK